jgi:hypothetical protein
LSGGNAAAASMQAANAYNPVATALQGFANTPGMGQALSGMFGGYNPGNWSNPAGSSGFYKYGGSNLDVGNMS